jgi:hypothetical protein
MSVDTSSFTADQLRVVNQLIADAAAAQIAATLPIELTAEQRLDAAVSAVSRELAAEKSHPHDFSRVAATVEAALREVVAFVKASVQVEQASPTSVEGA